jgi:hypothetical protein
VRARAQLELDGPPLLDPSWQYVLKAQTPVFPSYAFPIRLGDLSRLGDGLVGYFASDDYDQLNAVQLPPNAPTGYAAQIGGAAGNYLKLDFGATSAAYLTLLMDPRAPVHAVTDILPAATLSLPPRFTAAALSAMDLTLRVDPLLTTTAATKSGPALVMPRPSARHGTWTWVDGDGTSWPIAAADDRAAAPVVATLRGGWLDLKGPGSVEDEAGR